VKKIIVLLVIFSACQKAENKTIGSIDSKVIASNATDVYIQTDSIFFDQNKKNDFALAHLLSKKWSKDSICTADFKLDFVQKNQVVFSKKVTITGYINESEWYGQFLFDTKDSRFRTVSVGYPACGYEQHNFIFYIDDEVQQLVNSNISIGDAPYSSRTEFEPIYKNNTIVEFCSKLVIVDSDENSQSNEEDEKLLISYSDSTIYRFKNKKWSATLVTPKDKVYRKIKTTYN
jgi:hypothetical protein